MSDDIHEHIAAHVEQQMERLNAAIETACEQAFTTGTSGVLVVRHSDTSFEVSVDPTVPYGTIHERFDD